MYLKRNPYCLILISLLSLLSLTSIASSITLNIKKDFKAKGNGIFDDTKAFEDAAKYINNLKQPCILIIPQGIYRVGKQSAKNAEFSFPKITPHVFYLKNASKVTIQGTKGKSKIQYNNNLYYGSFDQDGNPLSENTIKRPFNNPKNANHLGCLFKFDNCTNVLIKDLILDGNMYPGKMNIGGGYGDLGTQLEHYGIYVLNSNVVKIQNCTTTRFGLDGIYLWNNKTLQPQNNILVDNCSSTYNGRQALSICSGTNIWIRNSSFLNTGKGIIASAPGAGIDVEPEDIYGKSYLNNVNIENCTIAGNSGPGILFPPLPGSHGTQVTQCTIVGNTNYSIWTQQKSVVFSNCKIYGTAIHNYPGTASTKEFATKYIHCEFSDFYTPVNDKISAEVFIYNKYLVSAATSDNVIYDNCTFHSKKSKVLWLSVSDQSNQYTLQNCNINTTHKENDGIWIPNSNIIESTFYFPKNTLHLGVNYKSEKGKIDAKSKFISK